MTFLDKINEISHEKIEKNIQFLKHRNDVYNYLNSDLRLILSRLSADIQNNSNHYWSNYENVKPHSDKELTPMFIKANFWFDSNKLNINKKIPWTNNIIDTPDFIFKILYQNNDVFAIKLHLIPDEEVFIYNKSEINKETIETLVLRGIRSIKK